MSANQTFKAFHVTAVHLATMDPTARHVSAKGLGYLMDHVIWNRENACVMLDLKALLVPSVPLDISTTLFANCAVVVWWEHFLSAVMQLEGAYVAPSLMDLVVTSAGQVFIPTPAAKLVPVTVWDQWTILAALQVTADVGQTMQGLHVDSVHLVTMDILAVVHATAPLRVPTAACVTKQQDNVVAFLG